MKSKTLLLTALCSLLILLPAGSALAQQWQQTFVGYSKVLDLLGESGASNAVTAAGAPFPKPLTITSWFSVNSAVNALLFCHGLTNIPPAGETAGKLNIKKVTTEFFDANAQRVGKKIVTKKLNKNSCKQISIPAGQTSLFAITTWNKVTGMVPAGTQLVPFGLVSQGIVSPSPAALTITDEKFDDLELGEHGSEILGCRWNEPCRRGGAGGSCRRLARAHGRLSPWMLTPSRARPAAPCRAGPVP